MDLDRITFIDRAAPAESLALSMMSVAQAAGIAIDYDVLCATLGLSCTAVSTSAENSPRRWMTYGRDAFVEPVGRMFGMHLRDLQPPDVALDMVEAEEFEQHWEYSYKPLIRRALENNQPVLAWQGWGDSQRTDWGVVTRVLGDDFAGFTRAGKLELQPMRSPALQCYVVERIDPAVQLPSSTDLVRSAIKHLDAYLNGAPLDQPAGQPSPRVMTGVAAYDPWVRWLEGAVKSGPADGFSSHCQHAETIAAGHASAGRFFRTMQGQSTQSKSGFGDAAAWCDDVSRLLTEASDPGRFQIDFDAAQTKIALIELIRGVQKVEMQIARRVHEISQGFRAEKASV